MYYFILRPQRYKNIYYFTIYILQFINYLSFLCEKTEKKLGNIFNIPCAKTHEY